MNTFGGRLKEAREHHGLNQSELARRCGVKSSTVISNWENDSNKPDIDKFVKLCIVLDTPPEVLLDYYPKCSYVLSPEVESFVEKFLRLDEEGKEEINDNLDYQLEVAENRESGYSAVSFLPIETPIWLPKDDPDYLLMKAKTRDLKRLKDANNKDTVEITKFLWSIGYTEGISRGSVYGAIELGTRVPNRQLYRRIAAFLKGKYRIVVDEENEE